MTWNMVCVSSGMVVSYIILKISRKPIVRCSILVKIGCPGMPASSNLATAVISTCRVNTPDLLETVLRPFPPCCHRPRFSIPMFRMTQAGLYCGPIFYVCQAATRPLDEHCMTIMHCRLTSFNSPWLSVTSYSFHYAYDGVMAG